MPHPFYCRQPARGQGLPRRKQREPLRASPGPASEQRRCPHPQEDRALAVSCLLGKSLGAFLSHLSRFSSYGHFTSPHFRRKVRCTGELGLH